MTDGRHASSARADERRRSLIEAAYRIIAEQGLKGLRTRAIAAQVEIDAPNPDALYEQLKEAGLPVTEPPEAKGWGDYTFVMYDPDGNCLEFSRPRNASGGSWT